MNVRYQKTDAGRAEIRSRTVDLPRPARNLLLIIDGTRSGDEWLAMVAGATEQDLQSLLARGLVSALSQAAIAPPSPVEESLADALQAAGFRALYDYLTSNARPRLGLLKGYRAVLDIERSTDVAALRRYAVQFVELVREAGGEEAARVVRRELSALR